MQEVDPVWGAPVPPAGGQRWWPIWSTRAAEPSAVLILSERIYGQWFHWTGQDLEPCHMTARCPLCAAHGDPTRWAGYVAALVGVSGKEAVWTISPNAGRVLKAQVIDQGQPLRGVEAIFARAKGQDGKARKTGKVDVRITRRHKPGEIRSAFPVAYSLHRLYGILSARSGASREPEQLTRDPFQLPSFTDDGIPLAS